MELDARAIVVDRARPGAPSVRALDGADIAVARGECVAIMGPTGSGKSTLALVLAGLLTPTSGSIGGAAGDAVRLVPQRPETSFLTERVLDEVALSARWNGVDIATAERAAATTLDALGLPAGMIGDRDPLTLSGGEQRRVAIAAVLASDPRVAILDEPSAGLDATAREELRGALIRARDAGRTLVFITHDPAEAMRLATRLVVLRAGRVVWEGPPAAVLEHPIRARQIGLEVAPEVRLAHVIAAARAGVSGVASVDAWSVPDRSISPFSPRSATGRVADVRELLPPAIDARARLIATAAVVAATLLGETLVGVAAVAVVMTFVVARADVGRARVRAALRPLIALGLTLALLQWVSGAGDIAIPLVPGRDLHSGFALAALRTLQVGAIILATLALSTRTPAVDLADALARLLRPLRVIRVPVDAMALIIATGIGFVPVLHDELDRLRIARAARGIRGRGRGPLARLRLESLLLLPLFVLAFRRAHLLAEALTVRGYDPDVTRTRWRRRLVPGGDIVLLVAALALVAIALPL